LGDGSLIILGGDINGGYVSTYVQNNPTYEFFPKRGAQIRMDFLNATVPMNLFPLTWLMPSGMLLNFTLVIQTINCLSGYRD
jgi:hypothetical protein